MKKIFKLFTAMSLAFGMLLAGCNKGGSTPVPPEPPVVENKFPTKEIIAFYDEAGLDVVVPAYVSEANDFETDTEDPAAFVVYANDSTHEEMVTYKDALVADSWVVESEAEGDFVLSYAETDAVVSLVDFEDYIGIAFSVYVAPEAHTAEEVAGVFNAGISTYGLSASYYETEGYNGWWLGAYLGVSEDDSEESLSSAVAILAQFLPDYLITFDEGYTAATETSDAEYSAFLVTEGFDVGVEIYGYLDSGYLTAEIYIYDIELDA